MKRLAWIAVAILLQTNALAQTPSIPDTVLVDQNGVSHRFYSDLVRGKLVLLNAIYTSCQGVCPVQTAIFAKVQKMLGDRHDGEVQIISITLDPETDTPARLKQFSEQFDVGPGWLFLTGPKADVGEVLEAMDLAAPRPEDHTPMAAAGHEPSGVWMKLINTAAPGEIVSKLDYVKSVGEQRESAR